MNKKSRNYIISVIFFSVCIIFTSCKKKEEYTVSLASETGLEAGDEGESVADLYEQSKRNPAGTSLGDSSSKDSSDAMNSQATIFVYITGQVKNPGVYSVSKEGRIYEVVELAGGFTSKACREYLNLAEKVVDGQHIHVLSKSQYKELQTDGTLYQTQNEQESNDSLVDINKATEDELMQLPGIGESKAEAIISYRTENGQFQSVEDIMQVPGIKEGAYEKIKSLIKV